MVEIQSPTAEIRWGKKERKKKKEEETTGREYSGLPYCIGQPRKIAICAPSHKFVELYLLNEGMYRQSEKTCSTAISPPRVFTIWWTSAHQRLRSIGTFGAPQHISTGFVSWLR